MKISNLWLAFLGSLYCSPLLAEWFVENQSIMGTNIHAEVWANNKVEGKRALTSVMQEMERINQLMSPYIAHSELSKLNQYGATTAVVVSNELFELIRLSTGVSEETSGAFDITFASVGFLYNYREGIKPSDQNINETLDAISYRHIQFDEKASTIQFIHPKVKVDLGGIAKGYAVDNAIDILAKQGIEHALVTAGGDTRLLGDRRGRPWMVGIRDPRNRDRQAVVLPLEDTAMSTSGDYERYFEQDGQRFHHILSPKSGKSVHNVQSVTIIGPRSTLNDALSTAVFVLGVEQGISLINRTPGYDAIIMDSQRKLHYSKELSP